jgi:hypothetical protein
MATKKAATKASGSLLQLKIELADLKPAIWRRVVVPQNITLAKLHQVIQATMEWTDSHLHEFEIAGCRFGIPDPEFDFGEPIVSEKRATLGTALEGRKTFRYVYDFGDAWEHKIKVEKMLPADSCPVPLCIGGDHACPPEDVGGAWGYVDFLEAIDDPTHPEHENMLEWCGGEFNPKVFNQDAVNMRLLRIKV